METSLQGCVTAPDCVRCNLCVEACPTGALAHTSPWSARRRIAAASSHLAPAGEATPGFRPLPIAAVAPSPASRLGLGYDLPLWGELVVLAAAAGTYLAVDVVYGGHFLAASLALGEGVLVFGVLRAIAGAGDATLLGRRLRAGRTWTLAGITATGILGLSLVPIGRAGLYQWYRSQGLRADPWVALAGDPAGQGLPLAAGFEGAPASAVAGSRDRLLEAAASYQRALALFPGDATLRKRLIWAHVSLGDRRALVEAEELKRRSDPEDQEAAGIHAWVARRFGER
jgi:ferredoxin